MNDFLMRNDVMTTNRNTTSDKTVKSLSGVYEVVEANKESNAMIYKKSRQFYTETDTDKYHDMFFSSGTDRQKIHNYGTSLRFACKGIFEIGSCEYRLHYGELPSPKNKFINLEVKTPSQDKTSISICEEVFCYSSILQKNLQKVGIFIDKKYLDIWLRDAIPKIAELTPTTKLLGWWLNEYGKLLTDKECEFRNGFESGFNSAKLSRCLGIRYGKTTNCQAVLLGSTLLAADLMQMLKLYGLTNLSSVCICVNDASETAVLLEQLMPDIVDIQNNDSNYSAEKCPVIMIDTFSSYLKKKMMTQPNNSPDGFSIYITEKSFSDHSDDLSERFLCFECDEFLLKEYAPLRNWFVVKALDNVDFMTELMNRYRKYSEKYRDVAKSSVANTAALLMAISEAYLQILDETWRTKLMNELVDFVFGILDGSTIDASAAFINYLCTVRDFQVVTKDNFDESKNQLLVNGDYVHLTRSTMQHISGQLKIMTKQLFDILKSKKLLIAESGFQKAVNINEKVLRMYTLRQSDIFRAGDIRFEFNGFHGAKPQLMLIIGECNSAAVYFTVDVLDGSENCHVMITGNTRTGKSTFLENIARQAVSAGIKVVNIGSAESRISLSGDKISVYKYSDELKNEPQSYSLSIVGGEGKRMDWKEVFSNNGISIIDVEYEESADNALAEFFANKVRLDDKTPCILILDECQEFSMNSKSPLMKVLRQGAKHGIMAFLSTQYLSQGNGTDAVKMQSLCRTKVVFKPVKTVDSLKQLDASSADTELRELLDSLGRGECVVKGSISTDKCRIDYPVKINVPKQN